MNAATLQDIKGHLGIEDADVVRVRALGEFVASVLPEVVEAFYMELARHEGAMAVFTGGEAQLARQRLAFAKWLRDFFRASWDDDSFQRHLAIGSSHVLAAVPQHFMVTGIHAIWQEIEGRVRDSAMPGAGEALRSFHKLLTFELVLMLESYKDQYVERVRKKERSAVEEKLTQAEHLAEIGELAASLAHGIKNPLAGISGAIQIMRDTMDEKDPHLGVVSEILGQIKRLDATVKDLLHYARPLPPRIAGFFLDEALTHVLKLMREEPTLQDVPVVFNGSEQKIEVCADRAQIEQLLFNLLLNAAHACEDGGAIELSLDADEDHVEIRVKDRGTGMSEETQKEAFEAFFTTKAKGTGLGLPICRRIAEEHGGSIILESELGIGTTVIVRWPRRAQSYVREEES